MPEHEFPLDADPVLRKYVKMEIERETAEIKVSEMKARFIRIAWSTLLSYVATTALWAIGQAYAAPTSAVSLRSALISGTIFSIILAFIPGRDIVSNWRDVMRAKRELRSWNDVIAEYQNKIKEEDSLKVQQPGS